jgi:membrane fusion protein (multidrug efflux system)
MTHSTKTHTPPKTGAGGAARIAITVAVVALLAWLAHFGYRMYLYEETDDAVVQGHVHQVSPQIDGTVKDVLASDNQEVAPGDVLVRLDPLEFQIQLEKEEAGLAKAQADEARAGAASEEAQAQLSGAQARLASAEAQSTQARVQQDLAEINRRRARQLFQEGGAVTQADLDNAESAYSGAQAALAAALANARVADASIGEASAALEATKAEALSAKASSLAFKAGVTDAKRKLAYATLVAPAGGRIGNRNVEAGNRVQAGQVLFALVEPDTWIVANFKETQIARMHSGLTVDVSIDALPGVGLHGTVESLSPASGAQFALLPPDNATGNFTKVVQRVPVKIVLDRQSARAAGERLRPGLSAVVDVRVR